VKMKENVEKFNCNSLLVKIQVFRYNLALKTNTFKRINCIGIHDVH